MVKLIQLRAGLGYLSSASAPHCPLATLIVYFNKRMSLTLESPSDAVNCFTSGVENFERISKIIIFIFEAMACSCSGVWLEVACGCSGVWLQPCVVVVVRGCSGVWLEVA